MYGSHGQIPRLSLRTFGVIGVSLEDGLAEWLDAGWSHEVAGFLLRSWWFVGRCLFVLVNIIE